MKANLHFWSYLGQFFLELQTFQTKVVEGGKTHFMSHNFFPEKKNRTAEPATDENIIWRMRIAC
jgi:hypothetical protein